MNTGVLVIDEVVISGYAKELYNQANQIAKQLLNGELA
jgi:hypothetical protein